LETRARVKKAMESMISGINLLEAYSQQREHAQ